MKRLVPFLFLLVGLALLIAPFFAGAPKSDFDLAGFSRQPVLVNGRTKPLDSVARNALLMLQGRQPFTAPDGRDLSPAEWLLDVLFRPEIADTYQHFRIDNSEVLDLFGLHPEDGAAKKRFSYKQLESKFDELQRQNELASQSEPSTRNAFQRAVISLYDHVLVYRRLTYSVASRDSADFLADINNFNDHLAAGTAAAHARQNGQPHDEAALQALLDVTREFDAMAQASYMLAIPPPAGSTSPDDWKSVGASLLDTFNSGSIDANTMVYAGLDFAWRRQQAEHFNTIVKLYRAELEKRLPAVLKHTDTEVRFNAAQPFYWSILVYVLAFLLAVVSWLRWPDVLGRSAVWLLDLAWVATTVGIALRMWLEGRPPVTNLYSSALFVGWGSVGLCLILERIFRNGIGSAVGGMIGFATLVIAHQLALGGDTLEMMRAVLDSNFWLSTHVVVVTLGYASTFLAGFLAIVYVARGVFTETLDKPTAQALARMVYGIVCFATLFSLVGTILGGIWADQSWGRFWGWDPKENGALIIVLWNALILHCRWGGLVKQRGLMILAIGGNIFTSWSWFGTNLLGVGLHSYGFTEGPFWWLIGFVASQIALIVIANTPLENWRSFRATPPTPPSEPAAAAS